ncbi:glycogen/starch synthase [Shewanella aestuarii]|uniref:starch synthase n=1 Tax=Shewanella aestuarii TaxID=1028752 RepID=A0A6G9QJA4_9GAMM|nr:glycogen/starch synthase [Shewanella aestuarii]QIR14644.1 glycogen synthase [Shewanella aestuarii]
MPCIFTIHNLALQGIRPYSGDESSFCHWFPQYVSTLLPIANTSVFDPRYTNCINPMRMGVVLSDKVHLVSTTYAEEVLKSSDYQKGFFGGEGLEADLKAKAEMGCVIGIINGCMYENMPKIESEQPKISSVDLLVDAENALLAWQAKTDVVSAVDSIALSRINQCKWQLIQQQHNQSSSDASTTNHCWPFLMTSVGRLTEQKVLILLQHLPDDVEPALSGKSVLEGLLIILARQQPQGIFILLGSGDKHIAKAVQSIAAKYSNFLFVNGYDETLSNTLYRQGDLFLMPSSFERKQWDGLLLNLNC